MSEHEFEKLARQAIARDIRGVRSKPWRRGLGPVGQEDLGEYRFTETAEPFRKIIGGKGELARRLGRVMQMQEARTIILDRRARLAHIKYLTGELSRSGKVVGPVRGLPGILGLGATVLGGKVTEIGGVPIKGGAEIPTRAKRAKYVRRKEGL